MTAVALAPLHAPAEPRRAQRELFAVDAGIPGRVPSTVTVADLVSGRWSQLAAGAVADCLVCGSVMEPRWSAGHGSVGGRCRSCGTSLD